MLALASVVPSYQLQYASHPARTGAVAATRPRATLPRLGIFDGLLGKKEEQEEEVAPAPEEDPTEAKRLRAEKLKLQAQVAELEAPPIESSPADFAGAAPTAVALCEAIAADVGGRFSPLAPLQEVMLEAWSEGRAAQQSEITKLRRQIEQAVKLQAEAGPVEEQSFGDQWAQAVKLAEEQSRSNGDDLESVNVLLELSENSTRSSITERGARARALTKATFKLFRRLTPYDEAEEEKGDAAKVPVPGEGVVAVEASKVRLRLLERHEAAACVEYRLFAYALSGCDELEGVAGVPKTLDEEGTLSSVTGFLGRWARLSLGSEMWQEMIDAEEDAEIKEKLQSSGSDLPVWLDALSTQLTKSARPGLFQDSAYIDLTEISEQYSFFPLLLAGLAARQGNLELFAVYYIARVLGRINLGALAEFEGRAAPLQPDQLVSQQEAQLVKKPLAEVISFAALAFGFSWLLLLLLGGALAWQFGNGVVDLFFAAPDPLAF